LLTEAQVITHNTNGTNQNSAAFATQFVNSEHLYLSKLSLTDQQKSLPWKAAASARSVDSKMLKVIFLLTSSGSALLL
jgi:hypothetical protein